MALAEYFRAYKACPDDAFVNLYVGMHASCLLPSQLPMPMPLTVQALVFCIR